MRDYCFLKAKPKMKIIGISGAFRWKAKTQISVSLKETLVQEPAKTKQQAT